MVDYNRSTFIIKRLDLGEFNIKSHEYIFGGVVVQISPVES